MSFIFSNLQDICTLPTGPPRHLGCSMLEVRCSPCRLPLYLMRAFLSRRGHDSSLSLAIVAFSKVHCNGISSRCASQGAGRRPMDEILPVALKLTMQYTARAQCLRRARLQGSEEEGIKAAAPQLRRNSTWQPPRKQKPSLPWHSLLSASFV
jgi:hypothetical protein